MSRMTPSDGLVAVVTGANRGLGLETCRQLADRGFRVVLTARRQDTGHEAASRLGVEHLHLDVTDGASIGTAVAAVQSRHGHLDVLVNNAGILMDGFSADVARRTVDVNLLGAIAVTDAFRPLLSNRASVVMVSSEMGKLSCVSARRRAQFEDPELTRSRVLELVEEFIRDVASGSSRAKGWPKSVYSVSKVGLNALARVLARELRETGIRVNAVCPGWVRTDMGGEGATRSVEKGAGSIVWAATLGEDGPSGGFYRDGVPIPW